jgi:hypothetical protein
VLHNSPLSAAWDQLQLFVDEAKVLAADFVTVSSSLSLTLLLKAEAIGEIYIAAVSKLDACREKDSQILVQKIFRSFIFFSSFSRDVFHPELF